MRSFVILISFLLISNSFCAVSPLSCRNSQGNQVDWWVIFKMPYDAKINPQGMEYFYCDSSLDCRDLVKQTDLLNNNASSPLFHTLRQVDKANSDQIFITWSDQGYKVTQQSSYGHSKGVMNVDSRSKIGFVINHSLPRFPMVDVQGNIQETFDDNARVYGQQFFCVSATSATIEAMADMYYVAEIRTSYSNFPEALKDTYPKLYSLKNNTRPSNKDKGGAIIRDKANLDLKTPGGLLISMLAKSQEYEFDFYDFVAGPYLKVNLFTQTWGNGVGGLDNPQCKADYRVQSNTLITMSTFMTYSYTKDHSKYAISQTTSQAVVCMGDLNRQESQSRRGGTSLCFKNSNLWGHISKMFSTQQTC